MVSKVFQVVAKKFPMVARDARIARTTGFKRAQSFLEHSQFDYSGKF